MNEKGKRGLTAAGRYLLTEAYFFRNFDLLLQGATILRSSERRTNTKKSDFGTMLFKQTVILKNCKFFGEHHSVKNQYIQPGDNIQ